MRRVALRESDCGSLWSLCAEAPEREDASEKLSVGVCCICDLCSCIGRTCERLSLCSSLLLILFLFKAFLSVL